MNTLFKFCIHTYYNHPPGFLEIKLKGTQNCNYNKTEDHCNPKFAQCLALHADKCTCLLLMWSN